MATFQAGTALRELVEDLKTWVSKPSFQRILKGKKGAEQAISLYAEVFSLNAPTEAQLDTIIQLAIELNGIRRLFRPPYIFSALELRLVCGKHCARSIAEASVAETDSFHAVKTILLDHPVLTAPTLIHRAGKSSNDVVYVDLDRINSSSFENLLTESGTALPFQLVKAFHSDQTKGKRILAFVDEDLSASGTRIEAYIRALSLNRGEAFHIPKKYTGKALARNHSCPTSSLPLEQFNDVQQVLSECFMEEDLLNRYLRLFQVLENFMVRKQIINVQRTTGSRAFSIRDFRRLYGETEAKEQETLTDLLKDALSIPTLINNKTLSQIVKERWDTEIHSSPIQTALANQLLVTYGPFPKSASKFDTAKFSAQLGNSGERHKALGSFVYRFRNMIVHNKETEFHLTHGSISPEIEDILNKFLLPSVDDIIFALINVNQDIVWYPHSTISLYKI